VSLRISRMSSSGIDVLLVVGISRGFRLRALRA
jgi:hypothetical protein